MRDKHTPLVAALALALLPFALDLAGLPLRSAIDVVVFAIACMGLNVLVGHTGLVSFGHGAWFGLGAYAAALSQRYWFPGQIILPFLFAIFFVAAAALLSGALILRRRGVYFSLLTLALTALLFAIGYRWTELTGGESGLGGVTRSVVLGLDLESDRLYYWAVAAIGMAVTYLLWRFHRSPVGSVLVAIRENEERARFLGYPTNRYKLIGFVLSATVVAIAGTLSVFNHRFASAEPLAVAFSGELVAMVVIGGMRSFLGPALGALFFILFREFLSIWTPHWLFYFGLLFVGFIVFSPTGLVGVAGRIIAPFRKRRIEAAAMAGRRITEVAGLPQVYRRSSASVAPVLVARDLVKRFGGIHAVDGIDLTVMDRTLHALIGPNGAGKTTAFNLVSGLFPPDAGTIELEGRSIAGLKPEDITAAGVGRSFQITNLFGGLSAEENLRLAVQARSAKRFALWTSAAAVAEVNEGKVLVDGTVEDARSDAKVREVYIGSGVAALAAKPRVSAAGATPLLVVDKVDTFYGKSHILNAVSLDVREHEIVALLGRNGAGKSTLLKTVIGIAPPGAGSIRVAGENTAGFASAEIARRGIGYVPQGRGLFAGMTVADNLALGRLKRITGSGIHWTDDRIASYFPRLTERWHSPADYLSGGEQQMLAVARALVGDVRVLLLDEPFEGLSPAVTEELFEAFDQLRYDVAMIIVDHHLDLALALSDRTVVLERGSVTWSGPSHALRDDLALRRKMLWM